MKVQLSEYFGDGNNKYAEVYREGLWYIARLSLNGKIVDHVSTFKQDVAEQAAEDWVDDAV